MVFKRDGILYRINNLTEPLALVANLAQLSKAIDSGAEQECLLDLFDKKRKHWVLECTFFNGIVALNVWLNTVRFFWDGSVADFRNAVNDLCSVFTETGKSRR